MSIEQLANNNQPGVGGTDSKACNCEKSKCLKLYCECFAKNTTCNRYCNCRDCHNTLEQHVKLLELAFKGNIINSGEKPRGF